jgi:uncharacterized protein YehS (DUF1456 family)
VTHNDTLDRLRAVLKLTDVQVAECFALAGHTLTSEVLAGLGAQVQGDARTVMTDALLGGFLDGLIIARRGPRPGSGAPREAVAELTHNIVLKKLRIALNLYEEDMLKLFRAGGKTISKGELTALFRKPTHKHYRECDDPLLSVFLEGIKQGEAQPKR